MNLSVPVLHKLNKQDFQSLLIYPIQSLPCDERAVPTCCYLYMMAMSSEDTEGNRFLSTNARRFRMSDPNIDLFLFPTAGTPESIAIIIDRINNSVVGHCIVTHKDYADR